MGRLPHQEVHAMARMLAAALALVLLVAVSPATASSDPLTSADVVSLAESGAGEELIRSLVDERGFSGPTGVAQVVALKKSGLSDALLLHLIAAAPPREDGEPAVEVRDGVLVVSGRGEAVDVAAEAEPEAPTHQAQAATDEPATHSHQPASWPSAPETAQNAFPAGATFGSSGGAVFVPSHFGESPSAFGKVVIVGPSFPVFYPVPVAVPVAVPTAPPSRYDRIPVRTSRGTIYFPN